MTRRPRWPLPLLALGLAAAAGVWTYGAGSWAGLPPPVRFEVERELLEGAQPRVTYDVRSTTLLGPSLARSRKSASHREPGSKDRPVPDWSLASFRIRAGETSAPVSSEEVANFSTTVRVDVRRGVTAPSALLSFEALELKDPSGGVRASPQRSRVAPGVVRFDAEDPVQLLRRALDESAALRETHGELAWWVPAQTYRPEGLDLTAWPERATRVVGDHPDLFEQIAAALERTAATGSLTLPSDLRDFGSGRFVELPSLAQWAGLAAYVDAVAPDWDGRLDSFRAIVLAGTALRAGNPDPESEWIGVRVARAGWRALASALQDASVQPSREELGALLDIAEGATRDGPAVSDRESDRASWSPFGVHRFAPGLALALDVSLSLEWRHPWGLRGSVDPHGLTIAGLRTWLELDAETRRTGAPPGAWECPEGVRYWPDFRFPTEDWIGTDRVYGGYELRFGGISIRQGEPGALSCVEARRERDRRLAAHPPVPRSDPPGEMVRIPGEPPLWVDRTEVTVAAYRSCVDAGACPTEGLAALPECTWPKPGRDDHPLSCIAASDFAAAKRYCAWAGKRLPTHAEWLRAALGDDGRSTPWDGWIGCDEAITMLGPIGDRRVQFRQGAGCGCISTWPVGLLPKGASPAGALDMVGNVAEVVLVTGGEVGIVGGAWFDTEAAWKLDEPAPPDRPRRQVGWGFRCVADAAQR